MLRRKSIGRAFNRRSDQVWGFRENSLGENMVLLLNPEQRVLGQGIAHAKVLWLEEAQELKELRAVFCGWRDRVSQEEAGEGGRGSL